MGDFKVRFGTDCVYNDPDYRTIYIKLSGECGVSCADRSGSDDDIGYVQQLIAFALSQEMSQLSVDRIPYRSIVNSQDRLKKAVADELGPKGITVNTLAFMNIAPTEECRKLIDQQNKLRAMAAMSPEELAKKSAEAQAAAQRYMDSLSPEQRRIAEEQARIELEKKNAEMQAIVDQAKSISAGAGAVAAAAFQTPKFCTNCGTPSNGGRFCSNCGAPYAG